MSDAMRLEIAKRLYHAFEERDGAALLELMHPDFVGEVTEGLPHGWGGRYNGREAMLRECWGRVHGELDTRPIPEEIVPTADGRLLVLGHYRGTARANDRAHEARFAHVLGFTEGRISHLVQITDSARWHEAVGG